MFSVAASADDYRDARAELVTAYEVQDYPAMRAAALKSLDARPAYPGGLFNLALAEVLGGDAEASLHALNELLEKKIDFGADEADEFAPLHDLPGWDAYVRAVTDLYNPIGDATVAYQHDVPDFIPEGIAVGPDGGLYLGSIRHGDIARIGVEPRMIAAAADGPHWSVFGMRYDGLHRLWFVSAAIDEFAGLDPGDAGKSGQAVVFDVASGTRVAEVGRQYDAVLCAAIDPYRELLATGGSNRKVRVHDLLTHEQAYEIGKHNEWITSLAFSPDATLLATADRAGGLFVWEAETGRLVHILRSHDHAIHDLAFSRDSNALYSAGDDGKVRMWNMDSGKSTKQFSAHNGATLTIDVAPDGRLCTGGVDRLLKLWKPDGSAIKQLPPLDDWIYSACFDASV